MSRPGLVLAALGLLIAGLGGTAGTPGRLPEDAEQEHGYYLRQLFGQYGTNGTLPFEGLARLLGSLGLGRVQVVQIQHEELGHGHVSHLDLLEVQEDKHRHRHPAWEHGGDPPSPTGAHRYRGSPALPEGLPLPSCAWGVWGGSAPQISHLPQPPALPDAELVQGGARRAPRGWGRPPAVPAHPEPAAGLGALQRRPPAR